MNKKKIWIISEMFYPDQAATGYIMTSIAKEVAEQSNEVHVICGPVGYDKFMSDKLETDFKFEIHRVKGFNFDKNNIIGRLVRMMLLSIGMFLKGVFSISKNDTAFIVTNPAFLVPFYAVIKKIKQHKLIILVHDVFPENLIPSKIISSNRNIFYRISKRLFDWSYQQADLLVVLGLDMLEIMRAKTKPDQPITIIENWADISKITPQPFKDNRLVKQYELQNKIVFSFAGNIGRVQGLEFLLKVIKQVKNPNVHFLFIGDGSLLKTLKADADINDLKSVTFTGHLPRNEQPTFLNATHVGLVTLMADLYGLGVPSKTYNIMAAAKPILFIGNKKTEIARMITDKKCGFVFDNNEEEALIKFFDALNEDSILQMECLGINARKLAENEYSEYSILKKFKSILI